MGAGFTSSDPSFPATTDDENSDDTDKQSQLTGTFPVDESDEPGVYELPPPCIVPAQKCCKYYKALNKIGLS